MRLLILTSLFFVSLCLEGAWGSSGRFFADNGLQQSVMYRGLGRKDQVELQTEILHLLGLQHRPKPRHHDMRSAAPQYLLDLYNVISEDENTGHHKHEETNQKVLSDSDFIMSFVNKAHHHFPHVRHERDKRFWFDVSEVPDEELVYAELRLFRNMTSRRKNKNLKLSIYSVLDDHISAGTLQLVTETNVTNSVNGWIALNVTGALNDWIQQSESNRGLYMKITNTENAAHSVDPHEAGFIFSRGEHQPILVAYFKQKQQLATRVRRTRAASPPRKQRQDTYYDDYNPYMHYNKERYNPRSKNCQRWTLYVSFKDLGWEDWIIAPDGYGAFYCQGECSFPLNAHMNATNHAIVQTLVHLMDPSVVPKPCCAPTQLSAITVLYFDDNSNVILKKYKNMIVRSCGCH